MGLKDCNQNPQIVSEHLQNRQDRLYSKQMHKQRQFGVAETIFLNQKGYIEKESWYGLKRKEHQKQAYIIKQRLRICQSSNLQVLGLVLFEILVHQILQFGYSPLKLNIIKTINDLQRFKIIQRVQSEFGFKTSSSQLITILNCSLKMIRKNFAEQGLSQIHLLKAKNKKINQNNYIKIHQMVLNHFKTFPICTNFFLIFQKMILILVKFPKLKLQRLDSNSRQIFFIVCDYLGCKIEEKQNKIRIDKVHYIQLRHQQIQFGVIKQVTGILKHQKSFTNGNKQTKSSIDLHSRKQRQKMSVNSQECIQTGSKIQFSGALFNSAQIYRGNNKLVSKIKTKIHKPQKTGSVKSVNQKLNGQYWVHKSENSFSVPEQNKSHYQFINDQDNYKIKKEKKLQIKCVKCSTEKGLTLMKNVINITVKKNFLLQKQNGK